MSESYEIQLLAEFSAAHRLRLANGDWEPLHGHNWKVEVHLAGPRLDAIGLLADFTQLQPNLTRITAELHDTYLNDLPAFAQQNPSTENVARHIHDRFTPQLPSSVRIRMVRVWETSTCAAAYLPDGG